MFRFERESLLAIAASLMLAAIPGCYVSELQPKDNWPAELAFLVEQAAQLSSDLEAYSITPATIETSIDDLKDLNGCWGAVVFRPTAIEGRTHAVYQFLKYDSETGVLNRYVIDNELFCGITIQAGTLSLTQSGRVILEIDGVQVQACDSAQPLVDVTKDDNPVYEMLVAFNNEGGLRVAFVPQEDDVGTPAGFADLRELVHVKVDCPE